MRRKCVKWKPGLREIQYFQTIEKSSVSVMTIVGHDAVIVGSSQATIALPMGTI